MLEYQSTGRRTLLMTAASHGNARWVRWILDQGKVVLEGINDADEDGKTALMFAADCGGDAFDVLWMVRAGVWQATFWSIALTC